jgi:sugar lactone lactonase YvrE
MTIIAGTGAYGFSGDNGPANKALLSGPTALALDAAGNLYIADTGNNRVRRVSNGIITTVAGNGQAGFSGDNGPATDAALWMPYGLAVDAGGDLYIADAVNNRVRKVSNGIIATIAGNGLVGYTGKDGYNGDGGSATSALVIYPIAVALDAVGDVYIAEQAQERVRKVSKGVITTIAGGGSIFGDHGPATNAQFNYLSGLVVGSDGSVYVVDQANNRIRRLSPRNVLPIRAPRRDR